MNEPTITAIGNITADPEIKVTAANRAVTKFTLAVTPRVKDGNDYKDGETIWFKCVLFGKPAEAFADNAKKGDRAVVTGRLTQNKWTTKNNEVRTDLEIMCDGAGLIPKGTKQANNDPW